MVDLALTALKDAVMGSCLGASLGALHFEGVSSIFGIWRAVG